MFISSESNRPTEKTALQTRRKVGHWLNYAMLSHLQRLTFNFTVNLPRRLPGPTILTHALTPSDGIVVFTSVINKSMQLVTLSPRAVSFAERARLLNSKRFYINFLP